MNTWQASVIKGNPAEIGALAKSAEVRRYLGLPPHDLLMSILGAIEGR